MTTPRQSTPVTRGLVREQGWSPTDAASQVTDDGLRGGHLHDQERKKQRRMVLIALEHGPGPGDAGRRGR